MLIDLGTRIPALSDSLSDRYLSHATVSRHLTLDAGGYGMADMLPDGPLGGDL
jgi:hypothetical protein